MDRTINEKVQVHYDTVDHVSLAMILIFCPGLCLTEVDARTERPTQRPVRGSVCQHPGNFHRGAQMRRPTGGSLAGKSILHQKMRKNSPLMVLSRYHDDSAGSSMPILRTMHRPGLHLAEGPPLEPLARHRRSSTCWTCMNRSDRRVIALSPARLLARSGFHPARRRLTTPTIDSASSLN